MLKKGPGLTYIISVIVGACLLTVGTAVCITKANAAEGLNPNGTPMNFYNGGN